MPTAVDNAPDPTKDDSTLDALGRVGRALADRTRAAILVRLAAGPAYPSELADLLASTRGNVSNHLTCLRGCGLVRAIPEGRTVRYELADARFSDLLPSLVALADTAHCDTCNGRERQRA
jgi:DNA-binding transcriptional ArsR family regulator